MAKMPRHRMWCAAILFVLLHSAHSLTSTVLEQNQHRLAGDWAGAKAALRSPECCVASVSGLEPHLRALQAEWADGPPGDLDLRARVRVRTSPRTDCLRVRRSVSPLAGDDEDGGGDEHDSSDDDDEEICIEAPDRCTAALEELARGVASLADGPLLEGACVDVFVRIVCASDYRARDPPFHTDKAPLRGYVTLRGLGTEFMTRPCSPIEYMALRTLGSGETTKNVRRAEELEFIVMKGDYYEAPSTTTSSGSSALWLKSVWQRASACVHRSPPAAMTGKIMGRRRVIVSLDLADGEDDREWYQSGTKRVWRNGLTQRKSRLVA